MGQNNLIFDVDIPLLEKILKAFCSGEYLRLSGDP